MTTGLADAESRRPLGVQLEAEARPVGDVEDPVDDLGATDEEVRPERVAQRVWEDFLDVAVRDRRDYQPAGLRIVPWASVSVTGNWHAGSSTRSTAR